MSNQGSSPQSPSTVNLELEKGHAEALTAFKDWSNYLLVTTVVAVGWIANDQVPSPSNSPPKFWLSASAWAFCLSVVFGIFTLALVPLVREEITRHAKNANGEWSIFDLKAEFRLIYLFNKLKLKITIKSVCWIQHVLFILGIVLYTYAKFGFFGFTSSEQQMSPTAVTAPSLKPSIPPVESGTSKLPAESGASKEPY
jgi:hypothetical protein